MNKNKSLLSFGFIPPIVKNRTEFKNMKKIEMEKLDVSKYVGTKAQIVKAEVIETKYGKCLKVETNPIPLTDGDKLPDGKIFRASILLSFAEKDGEIFIGTDSKLDKFCKEHKISTADIPDDVKVGDLIKCFDGVKVICQKSKTGFLEIA